VLTTELLFLLVILAVWFRFHLGWTEWAGSATIVVGLGVFFAVADPRGGHTQPSGPRFWLTTVILVAAVIGCIMAALRGPRWWRAAAFGAPTAVTAAFTAAITKSITDQIQSGWGTVLTHPQIYLLVVPGLGTIFLLQNALHAGPITASRTTLLTVNPMVGVVLGITLFADRLRSGPVWVGLELASSAVLVVGVVILVRSPSVAGTHEAGDLDELLGSARSRLRGAAPVGGDTGPTPATSAPGSAAVEPGPVTS
jgi:hypothetical protein